MKTRSETPEQFEKFKQELIEKISSMTYEDDPHILLVTSAGHGFCSKMALGCPGWMMGTATEVIENVNEAFVQKIVVGDERPEHIEIIDISTPEGKAANAMVNALKQSISFTGKGGEA